MRVAIFVLSLLAMASSEAGLTQALEASDSPALSGALSTLAMNNSNHMLADLAVPRLTEIPMRGAAAGNRNSSHSVRTAVVSHVSSPAANLPHAPMAGRGAALIQPLTSQHVAGQPTRSMSDHVLTGVVALMLIAYQLRRKHRVLRPHLFSH